MYVLCTCIAAMSTNLRSFDCSYILQCCSTYKLPTCMYYWGRQMNMTSPQCCPPSMLAACHCPPVWDALRSMLSIVGIPHWMPPIFLRRFYKKDFAKYSYVLLLLLPNNHATAAAKFTTNLIAICSLYFHFKESCSSAPLKATKP